MATENDHRLSAVGPLDTDNGFPLWFADDSDNVLELGLGPDQFLPAVDPPLKSVVVPGMPFPEHFPEEAFYFLAESRMPVGGAGEVGRARLILALEAAFGTPQPDPRSRVVFARIRIRMDDLVPGASYTVTHPYGVTDPLEADENGRVFVTDDRGIADNAFEPARANGLVAPFLRWTAGAPAGYLGDGATERPVTGSPFGTNYFRVQGPGIADVPGALPDPADPGNLDVVQSPLFTVQGRIASRTGAQVTGAYYTRRGGSVIIDLQARSRPGQTLETGGAGVARTEMVSSGASYVARVPAAGLPTEALVVNTTDAPSRTVASARVTDAIVATAVHDPAAGLLSVTAVSSDADLPPTLTVAGVGTMTGTTTVFPGVAATAGTVEITSSHGGRVVIPVALTGATLPVLPLIADPGDGRIVEFGDEVVLDGRASRGGVTSWTWSMLSGPAPATLETPAASTTRVHLTASGDYTFGLSVTAGAATAQAETTIHVKPFVSDLLVIDRADFRTSRDEFRITGTQTGTRPATIAVTIGTETIGSSPVDAAGAWSVRRALTPADNSLQPGVTSAVSATSSRGGATTRPIRIRN